MDAKLLQIGKRTIGPGHPVFIMAEAGANHNGDLGLAKELVVAAREAGADCIKFQTFAAGEFCADPTKQFTYRSQGKLVTESEYKMFKRLEFTREQWAELMAYCESQDILFLTTVQDPVSLTMMLELGLRGIKVGSDDFDYLQIMRLYAKTGLPLIVSKGMADIVEVNRVVSDIQPLATGGFAILHCVSLYPAEAHHLNLRQLSTLYSRFPHVVWGFSDHSTSTLSPALAVTLGAAIVEKHFTLDHGLAGPDHWFSMDPVQLKDMIRNIRYAEMAMGSGEVRPNHEEQASRAIMRRRVVVRMDLPAGAVLNEATVTFKRAINGCYAGDWDKLCGRRLRVAKRQNESVEMDEVA